MMDRARRKNKEIKRHRRWSPYLMELMLLYAVLFMQSVPVSRSALEDPRVTELVRLRRFSSDSVIDFDERQFHLLAQGEEPRPYSIILFMDADQLRSNAELKLGELREEFGLVARAYTDSHADSSVVNKVFFASVEYSRAQGVFLLLNVKALPHIRHVAPSSEPDGDTVLDASLYGRSAESIAQFVLHTTGEEIEAIIRPHLLSSSRILLLTVVCAIAFPLLVHLFLNPLRSFFSSPTIYCFLAMLVYFFSVSGGLYNIIRDVPMYHKDPRNPGRSIFFYQGSGTQLGAEGFTIGSLYTVVGTLLAVVSQGLPRVRHMWLARFTGYKCLILAAYVVKKVVQMNNWKTGYHIRIYWP
ncbi:hypothetical protein CBR_g46234 [Chara braunii]|uniref:Dolichyl-diphosphooligosaccharide--protein glycosyltransferase subunit 3 n=1 Tax=Chara braunii TaxID=69332 RepID=A0A388K3S1_CHABU|nr:hypothetical protein CBR_g46234 [Chara braunii]|eukprot:GBG64691.1 hypothetical protein CBR_g46234 [Chara braunii]